jgi:hypothetical protein
MQDLWRDLVTRPEAQRQDAARVLEVSERLQCVTPAEPLAAHKRQMIGYSKYLSFVLT